jgi:glycosyltransferase involved in cell wall biosynthesis
MRLARVVAVLEPGGAQLAIARISAELCHRGIETRVLAGSASQRGIELFTSRGIEVESWSEQGPLASARASAKLQYACSEGFAAWLRPRVADAGVVHAHMFGGWWAAAAAVPDGVPLAASEHNAVRWPDAPRFGEMRVALGRVDRFFAHGPATRKMILELGYPRDRLRRGVSPVEPGVPRPRTGLPSHRIVFAGRLHEEKGPDLLLDAVARMREPRATLMLGDGPGLAPLRRKAKMLGLERLVRFCGWRSAVGPWLAGASVCAVPSRHDAWSQTAVLAMRLGVHVVGTAVEGLRATLGTRRGVLVAPRDPDALAAAIEDVLSGRRRPDLGRARRYAEAFTPARVTSAYAREYAALIADGRPGEAHQPARDRLTAPALSAPLAAAG